MIEKKILCEDLRKGGYRQDRIYSSSIIGCMIYVTSVLCPFSRIVHSAHMGRTMTEVH